MKNNSNLTFYVGRKKQSEECEVNIVFNKTNISQGTDISLGMKGRGQYKAQCTCVEEGEIFICYTRCPCTVGAGSSI